MKTILAMLVAASVCLVGYAQPTCHKHHPRVNQVNQRMDRQEHRIHQDERQGRITPAEAHHDRQNLHAINREKHAMRRADNGHLTRADHRALNHQLNHNSREINHP